jgi:hypothetical protein
LNTWTVSIFGSAAVLVLHESSSEVQAGLDIFCCSKRTLIACGNGGPIGPGGPPSTSLTTLPAGKLKTWTVSMFGSAAVLVLHESSSEVQAGLDSIWTLYAYGNGGPTGPGGPPSTSLTTLPAGRLNTWVVSRFGAAAVAVLHDPSTEVQAGLDKALEKTCSKLLSPF